MSYSVGIDVSKDTLDFAVVLDGNLILEERIDNQKNEVKRFLLNLKKSLAVDIQQLVFCMEHTGIYNYKALEVLHRFNAKVCLEPALQIKQSQGMTRGKDDRVDARRIALYAHRMRGELIFWKPQRAALQKLQALLTMRDRLIKVQNQLRVPLQESVDFLESSVVKSLKISSQAIITLAARKLKELDVQIKEIVKADQKVKKQHDFATSVPGIGMITSLQMIIRTGEFQRITNPKKFSCYAGSAPFKHQSGSSIRGKTRVSRLANMKVKTVLTLGATSAVTHDPELRQYYQRKIAHGKNHWSVINAVRNKLITRVFACVLQERKYQKNYTNALA
jgi:transposase